jgi:hypothetical protein
MRPQGLKPTLILGLYAALKRRSSTVLHAFVSFSAARKLGRVQEPILNTLKFVTPPAALRELNK